MMFIKFDNCYNLCQCILGLTINTKLGSIQFLNGLQALGISQDVREEFHWLASVRSGDQWLELGWVNLCGRLTAASFSTLWLSEVC